MAGQVTGERSRISGREYLGVLAHPELKLTVKDQEQLAGSHRVRLAGVTLPGSSVWSHSSVMSGGSVSATSTAPTADRGLLYL